MGRWEISLEILSAVFSSAVPRHLHGWLAVLGRNAIILSIACRVVCVNYLFCQGRTRVLKRMAILTSSF